MSNRWERFRKRKHDEIELLKPRLIITLFGSYNPTSEKNFLIKHRDFLRDNKFAKTSLVIDYPNPSNELTSLQISEYCLEFSDVSFLIFTKLGKRQGLIRELAHIAKSPNMKYKSADCVVFDQVLKGRSSVPALSMEDIKNTGIERIQFSNESDLQESMLTKASWYVRKFSSELKLRN